MDMTLTKAEMNTLEMCRDTYFVAKAYHETIKVTDLESRQAVLNEVVFKYERKDGERITDAKHDFLMSDEDSRNYWELCHNERTKRGLKIPDAETASDFESWKLLKLAEDRLVDYALSILPEPLKTDMKDVKESYKYKQKFLELICKLDIKTIKERKVGKC